MKNFCLALLIFLFNFAFASENLKDPKLINIVDYKKTNSFSQKKKAFLDKKEYSKYKNIFSKEEYEIYLITDKILRANNLQYKNWRIGFNLEKDVINAVSLNNNLILINSSLYDCLHQNKDALAYVICHELAHFILSHKRITIENTYKIKRVEDEIKKIENLAISQKQAEGFSRNLKNLINNIYLNMQNLELLADGEALELLLRAGYNFENALEIFEYVDEDYNFYENKNIYPLIYKRIDNLLAQYKILDIENLVKEGENNLFLSNVLSSQKSMDKETIVINHPENYKEYSYSVQSKVQKLLKKAYRSYLKEEIDDAIEYFTLASEENENDYIAFLYLSYCYEYRYQKYANKNDLKLAKKYIKKAKTLQAKDKDVIAQYKVFYKR